MTVLKSMKIDVYCYDDINNPRCGGGGAYRELVVHQHIAKRHKVRFFTGNFKGAKSFSEQNFVYTHLGLSFSYLLSRISFSIAATARSFFSDADIIAIPYSIYSPVLTFLFKPDKTVILFFHITGKETIRKYGIIGYLPWCAEKLVLGIARNFITLTDSMARDLLRQKRTLSVKAGYVSFNTSLSTEDQTDGKFILCFGRIDIHMKGIDILVSAFEKIAPLFPVYKLIIAGRGKEKDITWLKQRIDSSPQRSDIQCLTNVDEATKKNLFHNATFVCMPSRFEGWNIAAIEAAACSRATLGTRIHGLTDAIQENVTGLLVEPENIDELAEKMSVLLSDTSLREKLGKNGFKWSEQFSLERIVKIQEDFYREVHVKNTGVE
jgi:glycosyltransferase involved in cell wall biosynthesis